MLVLRRLAVLVPALAVLSVPVAVEAKGVRAFLAKQAVRAAIVHTVRKKGEKSEKDEDDSKPAPTATRDLVPEPVIVAAAPVIIGPPNQHVCLAGCYDSLGRSMATR